MINDEIKISIIIPVYNVGKYINTLIESFKAQTLKDLEFIFVDDCGTDNSMSFVYAWKEIDPRVIIIKNQHNLGVGESRNIGMRSARGLYINAMDPDDWVSNDYYELLYKKAIETNADIVKGKRIKINEENKEEIEIKNNLNDIIENSLANNEPLYLYFLYEHATMIFKKSLLDENVKYGNSNHAEDTTFLLRLCNKAKTYTREDNAIFYYLIRKDSATSKCSLLRTRNELISLSEQIDFLIDNNIVDEYAYKYCANRYNTYISNFIEAYQTSDISFLDKQEIIKNFKNQIIRLPNYENLYKYNKRIYALINLDIVLVNYLYNDLSIAKYQAKDWMKYIFALEEKEEICDEFKNILIKYIGWRRKDKLDYIEIAQEFFEMAYIIDDKKQKKKFYLLVIEAFKDYFKTRK